MIRSTDEILQYCRIKMHFHLAACNLQSDSRSSLSTLVGYNERDHNCITHTTCRTDVYGSALLRAAYVHAPSHSSRAARPHDTELYETQFGDKISGLLFDPWLETRRQVSSQRKPKFPNGIFLVWIRINNICYKYHK